MSSKPNQSVQALSEISRLAIKEPVVSFDIFDTLVRRRFLAVNEVHDTVSAYLLARLGRFGAIRPGRLTLARYNTGNFLKTSPHQDREEPDLESIWTQVLNSFPGASPPDETLVRDVVRFEFDIELQNLAPVDGAAQLLSRLKAQGKTLIAVSDMYFPGAWIEEILTKLGLRGYFDHVFVSCDEGATKQTGNLFRVVLDRLGITASEVMHIGDNPHSDISMGRRAGLSVTHVDQHAHLHLERPAYGRRPDIHTEISDLIKLFLLHARFHALNNRSEHLYFLSRDGLLLNQVWQGWNWPLLNDYLRGIEASDLYLSRATSCWLALNFNADWMPQAIGLAFWLCHGRATARQISDLLGIREVPEALGSGVYDSATQSDLVVQAYRRAKLVEAIKASLLGKRGLAERYLEQLGFFAHRRVTLCDVGYSGTVARDLNSFFLQESLRKAAPQPPTIDLALIATNGNYEQNSILAQPYVHFGARALLESETMPASLIDSYAWLEFFFKHPTYGPLLAYEQHGDRVEPTFETGPEPDFDYPSRTVLTASGGAPEDVILLWMALTEHWDFFTGPLIARFSVPDLNTLRQMQGEIYEADAVSGRRRSVAATLRDKSADEIYLYAKQHDYWIPGSLLASARSTPDIEEPPAAPPAAAPVPARSRGSVFKRVLGDRRVKSFVSRQILLRRVKSGARPFDPDFYRVYHPDLRLMDDEALLRHFLDFGIREGRPGTPDDLIERLERSRGALPRDFEPEEYQALHGDLGFTEPWRAREHYLVFGRPEGRAYRLDFGLQDDEFAELVNRGLVRLTPAEQAEREAGTPVARILFRRAGLRRGGWLHHLQFAEFQALNGGWTGPLVSRAHAIEAFLREGIGRLAPLSLGSRFDPVFYRGRHPDLSGLDDEALYRHWLGQGADAGEAASAEARLMQLVEQQDFPAAFRVELFRSRHAAPGADEAGEGTPPDDLDLLARFMDGDYTAFADLAEGPGAARLWEVYARRARGRGLGDAARQGYENALQAGGPPGRLWHQIADIDRVQGRDDAALAGFQRALDAPQTDRWSFIEGAGTAARKGDFARALAFLSAGKTAWADKEPWRRTRDHVLQNWFDHAVARPGAAAFLEEFRRAVAADVPAFGPRSFAGRDVVVLSDGSLFDGGGGDERPGEAALRERFGPGCRLFRAERRAEVVGLLPWASCVVLHETRADLPVIRIVEYARALSIPVVYWIGGFDGRSTPPFRGDTGPALRSLLSCERARFAMSLCDSGAAPLPEALHALETLTRNRAAICVGALARAATPPLGSAGTATVVARLPEGEVPGEMWTLLWTLLNERRGVTILVGGERTLPRDLLAFAHRVHVVPLSGRDGRDFEMLRQAACLVDLAETGPAAGSAEAAALGLPCLRVGRSVQAADPFGQPAANWRQAAGVLLQWIDEPERRREIGRRARAAFEARFPPQAGSSLPAPAEPAPRASGARPRILFANVFFPPQTIGGATRVLKDNVDDFLDQAGDAYDFAVLTSDDENGSSGAARIDAYRGVPVFRIATPQEIDMDWRPHNPRVGQYAAEVIRLFKPDLVHIHCLQRLSVAVAEACEAAGVPYVVTLHDAWWLSDYSFLTDEDGRLCPPSRNLLDQGFSRRIGLSESLARGERLRTALSKARTLLSVSEPFAELFRACGFEARVVANGASRLDAVERVPSAGRVRLLHLGGTQHHKGAYLLEAALRANAFDHLELTIINLFRDSGDETETVWGTTPVRILGKVASDRIAALYARGDVLIAPSTWPESFGLVSREAAASGCWVVASRLGAMGDVVRPGENGFLIDVSSPDGLVAALREIDADPGRYTLPPVHRPALRTASDQARDLLEIYAVLLAEAGR